MPRSRHDPRRSRTSRPAPDPITRLRAHLTFGPDPATSMVVSWISDAPVRHPQVRLRPGPADPAPAGAGPADDRPADADTELNGPTAELTDAELTDAEPEVRVVDAVTRSYRDSVTEREIYAHHALFEGLAPATEYHYEIPSPSSGSNWPGRRHRVTGPSWAARGSFRTAPAGRAAFTFTCFGDHGSDHPDDPHGTPASAALVAGVEQIAPLFTLVNGDLAYSNANAVPPAAWSGWFEMISPSASRRPWMPSAGNHEIERGNGALGLAGYQTYFQLPDNGEEPYLNGLWYAFTVGGVRFLVLSGDDVCYQDAGRVYLHGYSSGRQTAWLERQLKLARADDDVDWIIVAAHQPAVSTAEFHNGADLGLRERWLPLFDQYGVDLVLSAHEHHYERTHALRGVVEGSETLTPLPVPAATTVVDGADGHDPEVAIDTTRGGVHMLVGTGGSSSPSAHALFDPPACRVTVGVRRPAPGSRHRPAIRVVEDAPWLAARFPEHPYAFAGFVVDPGQPGGTTRIRVTAYDSSSPHPAPFDAFTLVRPRGDADRREP